MPSVLTSTDLRPTVDASPEEPSTEEPGREEPSIFVDPSAVSLLPGDVTVLARFIQFLSRDVLREHVPVSRIEIRGSVDPEEDTSQIVVRLWMHGIAESEVRHCYQEMGARVDEWTAQLPETQKQQFFSRLSFQARREADA